MGEQNAKAGAGVTAEQFEAYRAFIKPSADDLELARLTHEAAQEALEEASARAAEALVRYSAIKARNLGALIPDTIITFKENSYRIDSVIMSKSRYHQEIDGYKVHRVKKDGTLGAAKIIHSWDIPNMQLESLPAEIMEKLQNDLP